jgi:hypothetical protein
MSEESYRKKAMRDEGLLAEQAHDLRVIDSGLGASWHKYKNPERLMEMKEKMEVKNYHGIDISADLQAYYNAQKEERKGGVRRKAKKTTGRRKSKKATRRTRKH